MVEATELGGVLKRIGNYDPHLFEEDFDQRLILQKTVYLLQAFGLFLGYRFNWYLRGPYCVSLARHGYELVDLYDKVSEATFVNENAEERFKSFLKFMPKIKDDAEMLEIIASTHFIKKRTPNITKERLFNLMRSKILTIDRKDIEEALHILKDGKMIDDE